MAQKQADTSVSTCWPSRREYSRDEVAAAQLPLAGTAAKEREARLMIDLSGLETEQTDKDHAKNAGKQKCLGDC